METTMFSSAFDKFGATISSFDWKDISVTIDPEVIMEDYAKAYADRMYAKNPGRFEALELSEKVIYDYFKGLLAIRVQSIQGTVSNWKLAQTLWIPSIIQYVISCVGEVRDMDKALHFIPAMDYECDPKDLLETSLKIGNFKADGLTMVRDGFPRSKDGDVDVMQFSIIENFLYSTHRADHPSASYVAGLLGLKAKEATVGGLLYRVRYDSTSYIRDMLRSCEEVW